MTSLFFGALGRRRARRYKTLAGPIRGTARRTARVSTARWDLKEAAGKALTDEQEAHEACTLGETANIVKARN